MPSSFRSPSPPTFYASVTAHIFAAAEASSEKYLISPHCRPNRRAFVSRVCWLAECLPPQLWVGVAAWVYSAVQPAVLYSAVHRCILHLVDGSRNSALAAGSTAGHVNRQLGGRRNISYHQASFLQLYCSWGPDNVAFGVKLNIYIYIYDSMPSLLPRIVLSHGGYAICTFEDSLFFIFYFILKAAQFHK